MSILVTAVSYRPVIGFGDKCSVCGRPTLRYGKTVTVAPNSPLKGMPLAIQAQGCNGEHTLYVD